MSFKIFERWLWRANNIKAILYLYYCTHTYSEPFQGKIILQKSRCQDNCAWGVKQFKSQISDSLSRFSTFFYDTLIEQSVHNAIRIFNLWSKTFGKAFYCACKNSSTWNWSNVWKWVACLKIACLNFTQTPQQRNALISHQSKFDFLLPPICTCIPLFCSVQISILTMVFSSTMWVVDMARRKIFLRGV